MASLWFWAHIGRAAVAASPICSPKPQTSHVSKGSDHVLYLSYLKNAFWGQNVVLFHLNLVTRDLFALRLQVLYGQYTKIFLLHFFMF